MSYHSQITQETNKPKPLSFPLYCVTSLKSTFKRTKDNDWKYRWNSSYVFIHLKCLCKELNK